jgi:hypothetical protein
MVDKEKIKYAVAVIGEIIKDGERYYIDDWTNALNYTKSLLEWHLLNEDKKNINSVNPYPSSNEDDYESGDNIHW